MKRLATLVLVAAATLLAGCPTETAGNLKPDPNLTAAGEIVVRMAIRRGVSDYIAKHGVSQAADRAARVKAVLDDVLLAINGDGEVTLAGLKAAAFAAISDELTPLEQQDARDVIDLVALALQGYIDQGTLNPAALVKLRDALSWISAAAATFAPPA